MVSTRRKTYENQPKKRFRGKTNEQDDVTPMEQDVKPTKTAQPNHSESSTLLTRVVDTMSMKSIATELEKIDVDVSMKSDALSPQASGRNRKYNYNPHQNNNDGNGMEALLKRLEDCSMNDSADSPRKTKSSARTRFFFQNATVRRIEFVHSCKIA